MRIVLSRKGFDTGAGGIPSPIIDGRPISLPIPTQKRSITTYGDLGLGEIVEGVTKGRLTGNSLCHYDPMLEDGRCAFGQTGAAQTHLHNNGVTVGDIFLFFGLFAETDGHDWHHRIFGYLEVQTVHPIGAHPEASDQPSGFSHRHPHTLGEWNANNTIYIGRGRLAATAHPDLRLSIPGDQVSRWRDCPAKYGPHTTIYNRYNRWSKRRIWQRIFEKVAAAGPLPEELCIDTSHVKAHRSAAGSKRGSMRKRLGARAAEERAKSMLWPMIVADRSPSP